LAVFFCGRGRRSTGLIHEGALGGSPIARDTLLEMLEEGDTLSQGRDVRGHIKSRGKVLVEPVLW